MGIFSNLFQRKSKKISQNEKDIIQELMNKTTKLDLSTAKKAAKTYPTYPFFKILRRKRNF